MTGDYQRAMKILGKIKPENGISQDDVEFLTNNYVDLFKIAISKTNSNANSIKVDEQLQINDNIRLEDISHVSTIGENDANNKIEGEQVANRNTDENAENKNEVHSEQANYILYNFLITLPNIIFCFEDLLNLYIFSNKIEWYFAFYVFAAFLLHGSAVGFLFYQNDKKRRKSIVGGVFSGTISAGKIIGIIFGLLLYDKEVPNYELKQTLCHCLTALVFYGLAVFLIGAYQTKCFRHTENINAYN